MYFADVGHLQVIASRTRRSSEDTKRAQYERFFFQFFYLKNNRRFGAILTGPTGMITIFFLFMA